MQDQADYDLCAYGTRYRKWEWCNDTMFGKSSEIRNTRNVPPNSTSQKTLMVEHGCIQY